MTRARVQKREKTSSIELNFDKFIREVCVVHIAKNPIEMGGPAGQERRLREIDESKFGKRKYNRRRLRDEK
jgi:hypothetical protein